MPVLRTSFENSKMPTIETLFAKATREIRYCAWLIEADLFYCRQVTVLRTVKVTVTLRLVWFQIWYWKGNAFLRSIVGIRSPHKVANVIECKWNRFEVPLANVMRPYVVREEASAHFFTQSVWHLTLGNRMQSIHTMCVCIVFATHKPNQNSGL